ncbi:hypothetical protein [Methylobacter sp.]|nr:hypothetical protein [Methylobacter sp.]
MVTKLFLNDIAAPTHLNQNVKVDGYFGHFPWAMALRPAAADG